jgi:glycosyltransferase involved in cell wall biosynthesis
MAPVRAMTGAGDGGREVLVAFHEEVLGGATRSLLGAVPALERRGWRFVFWAARPSELFDALAGRDHEVHGARRPVAYGLRRLRAPPGPRARLAALGPYLGTLRRLVADRRPALVHANSLYALAEAAAARAAGAPVLLHVHEIVPGGAKGAAARAVARAVARERVAVSAASAASLRDPRARVVFEAADPPAAPATIRDAPRPFVVGTVGAISRRKGSDVFVEAARRVLARTDAVAFRMLGAARDPLDPAWGERVLDDARRLGIEHGVVDDAAAAVASWDAFVLPSREDPFPLAMLEAMAAGVPVIGSAAGGIPEQVAPGCGVLVPPGDPGALADAILALAAAPAAERAAMGAAARDRVAARFTVEHQAAGLHAAYLAAARPPTRPA